MSLIYFLAWLFVAGVSLREDRRSQGDTGRERLLGLDAFEARGLQRNYRSPWTRRLLVVVSVLFALNAVFYAADGGWLLAAVGTAASAVCLVAVRSHTRTAPHVLAILDERDLSDPSLIRETSQRRRLRVKQYGAVAALAFLAALPALILGDSTLSTVVGIALLSLAGLALVGLAWASAWRYGDEQPVPEPDPTS